MGEDKIAKPMHLESLKPPTQCSRLEGFWDASARENGKSGLWRSDQRSRLGQVGDNQQSRGNLLNVGTALAAKAMGVCVLTEILDLIFHKCLCIQNINRCIDKVLDRQ